MSGPEDQNPADINDSEDCGRPCPPELKRDCCMDYWHRMVLEGFWDEKRHEWTAKGMREMCK